MPASADNPAEASLPINGGLHNRPGHFTRNQRQEQILGDTEIRYQSQMLEHHPHLPAPARAMTVGPPGNGLTVGPHFTGRRSEQPRQKVQQCAFAGTGLSGHQADRPPKETMHRPIAAPAARRSYRSAS